MAVKWLARLWLEIRQQWLRHQLPLPPRSLGRFLAGDLWPSGVPTRWWRRSQTDGHRAAPRADLHHIAGDGAWEQLWVNFAAGPSATAVTGTVTRNYNPITSFEHQ